MKRLLFVILVLLIGCAQNNPGPIVAATYPANGDSVHASLDTIMVTFNKPMTDKSWSWVYESPESFPEMTGEPYYDETMMINYLPVKLEPQKTYVIWINKDNFMNFKDASGNPARPHKFTFSTKAQ